jgi:hypothetical protein
VLIAVLGYTGFTVGRVYLRYYQFQDAVTQQAKFAATTPDDTIITRLRAQADSLDLPTDAQRIHIHRTSRSVVIWSEYADSILLPGVAREVDFQARGETSF